MGSRWISAEHRAIFHIVIREWKWRGSSTRSAEYSPSWWWTMANYPFDEYTFDWNEFWGINNLLSFWTRRLWWVLGWICRTLENKREFLNSKLNGLQHQIHSDLTAILSDWDSSILMIFFYLNSIYIILRIHEGDWLDTEIFLIHSQNEDWFCCNFFFNFNYFFSNLL